jgi:hypothetical protein
VLERVESYTNLKAQSMSFHDVWAQSLHVLNAQGRALPPQDNPWVKGFLPHIYSTKEKSVLVDTDDDSLVL